MKRVVIPLIPELRALRCFVECDNQVYSSILEQEQSAARLDSIDIVLMVPEVYEKELEGEPAVTWSGNPESGYNIHLELFDKRQARLGIRAIMRSIQLYQSTRWMPRPLYWLFKSTVGKYLRKRYANQSDVPTVYTRNDVFKWQ